MRTRIAKPKKDPLVFWFTKLIMIVLSSALIFQVGLNWFTLAISLILIFGVDIDLHLEKKEGSIK